MTSSLRPAICMPCSCQYSSQPLYMSLPAWAMAPEIGERNPILIGAWAEAGAGHAPTISETAPIRNAPFRIAATRMGGAPFRAWARDSLPLGPPSGIYERGARRVPADRGGGTGCALHRHVPAVVARDR